MGPCDFEVEMEDGAVERTHINKVIQRMSKVVFGDSRTSLLLTWDPLIKYDFQCRDKEESGLSIGTDVNYCNLDPKNSPPVLGSDDQQSNAVTPITQKQSAEVHQRDSLRVSMRMRKAPAYLGD
jgi:hypothetical protein